MTNATQELLETVGFSSAQTQQYPNLERQGRTQDCARMLRSRRCELVEALHEAQRPIDVIDWAIYELQRS